MDRHERYQELVQQRKACACCPGLANASHIDGGELDSQEIGPYSRWQGKLDPDLLVVAQDFADIEGFRRYKGWPGATVPTNLTLVDLLKEAGITIQPPRLNVPDDQLFFTNAVLCMKTGGMGATIPRSCFDECGQRFLRPTIELVSPKVVVSLGAGAMKAVFRAYGLGSCGSLASVVGQPILLPGGPLLMPLYHPGRRVLNTYRSLDEQKRDWRQVGRILSQRRADVVQ